MQFLGVDIGGSKCRYERSEAGAGGDVVLGECNAANLARALEQACAAHDGVVPVAAVCAVTGIGSRDAARELERELRASGIDYPVRIVGDVLAAAAAGLHEGPGVLLWSGTGSFAIARGDDGALARVGGRGFAFGDEGSGYDLVRRAIVAVLRAIDGRGRETVLTDRLTRAFDAPDPSRLGAIAQRRTPGEVARHLPVVLDAFAADDWVAADVLEAGMHQLVQLAEAALRKVGGGPAAGVRVALGGGVLSNCEPARDGLIRMLQAAFGGELPVTTLAAHAAANAAAWLAKGWHERAQPQQTWVDDVTL